VCARVVPARRPVLAAREWLLRSADELDFLSGERMAESLEVVAAIAATVDGARRTTNLEPYGESQVGRRELTGTLAEGQLPTADGDALGGQPVLR
jgi:aminopeptidase-like protein